MHSKLSIMFILAASVATFAAPSCPGGAKPFEGTGRAATESKARENANSDIARLFSNIKVDILDELTQRDTNGDVKEYANYQRKIKVEGGLYSAFVKDTEYPYPKENGQFVARRYLCPNDAAKPYLDSLKIINQRVAIQKVNNSFCESLYKTYSPKVVFFERILERFGETAQVAEYKKVEKECDDLRGSIRKGFVGFEEALDKAVAEISTKQGKVKTKIVIAEIYASSSNVADFISTELESKLVKVKTFAIGPAIIPNEQTKIGPMKDADAIAIGKSSKANIVIVGSFKPFEGFSHFMIKALEVPSTNIQISKTLAMHTDKVRPDDDVLAGLITDKLSAITEDALAYLNKGEDLYRAKKYDEAIKEFDMALAINKNLADGYYLRGAAYFFKGNGDRAIEDWTTAIRIKPNYYQALSGRGLVYQFKGNGDRAIEDFNAALRIKPDDYETLLNRGAAYDSKGNYDRAIEDYNAALRIKSDFLYVALTNRGLVYSNKGNYDRAIEDFNAALRIKPDFSGALFNRGVAYAKKGNYDRAIEDYNSALRIKPDYHQALLNRGIAYTIKDNLDRAIEDWESVLRIDPNNANAKKYLEKARQEIKPDEHLALFDRGVAYAEKGNYDRAIEDFNAALKIKPDFYLALKNRGIAYSNKDNYDRAIEDFNAVLRIKPNDHEALYNRGSAYDDKGNYDRAIEDYTAALRIKPDLHQALFNRGLAYKHKGNYDRAIEDYTAALRIKPDKFQALNNRGLAYDEKGNYDRAIEDYNAALRIKPDYQEALNNRGIAYVQKGNLDLAIKDWEAVLRIDPNDANARRNLERARQLTASKTSQATPKQSSPIPTASSLRDTRDNKTYKVIKIGTQTWMAENLNYNASGSKCYDNKESNCQKYGRLYNWATAKKACPSGWHLPSKTELETLVSFVGDEPKTKLKATSGWRSTNGTDDYGFSALPGDYGYSSGFGGGVGGSGYWWSSTEGGNAYYAYYIYMREGYPFDGEYTRKDDYLYSVRCVQD